MNSITFLNETFEEFYGFNERDVKSLIEQVSNDSSLDLFEPIYINLKGYYSHSTKRKTIYTPVSILNFLETKSINPLWKASHYQNGLELIYHLYMRSIPHDFQDIIELTEQRFSVIERNIYWHIIDNLSSHPQRRGLFL